MTFTTAYTAPVFDTVTYHKILSRIGRLKKSLSGKQYGSEKYRKLNDSLLRAEQLRKRNVNMYISDLAIYCIVANVDPTIHGMEREKAIPDDKNVISILLDHWDYFQKKVTRVKQVYKPGDEIWIP